MLTIRDIFSAYNKKAREGLRVIGAHIGPHRTPPCPLSEILSEMGDVCLNYLPFSGMDEAREAISSFGKEFLGRDYAPIKYSLHNGGAQSIFISAFASLNRSDYVVGIVPGATFRSEGE